MNTVQWLDSTSWELPFYGLPSRAPWPAEVDAALINQEPLQVEHLLSAIERLGAEAGEPWSAFLQSNDHFADVLEAMEENELRPALAALEEIDRLLPGTAFTCYHRALLARREGNLPQAAALLQEAAQKTPQVAAIWSSLGTVQLLRGEAAEASSAFRHALTLNSQEPGALEGLVSLGELVRLRNQDPQRPDAVQYVETAAFRQMALRQISGMVDVDQLLAYGDQLLRQGAALEAAIAAFERASQLRPAQPPTMQALAAAYRATGQQAKARELLERYTRAHPQDPNGFLHLAQACQEAGDAAGEKAAVEGALQVDPNSRPALAAHFALGPNEHDPAKEDALQQWGSERGSWMAYLLAGTVARQRGDFRATLRQVERAYALAPGQEEVLLQLASALAENKELGRLSATIRPAVESGRFSKRLAWHYAHVLRELNLPKDALAVLQQALQGEVSEEFRQLATTTMEAWQGRVTGSGVPLELMGHAMLQRPVLIALEDGDGGVLLPAGQTLPQEKRFPWRPVGNVTLVRLQQGESGGSRAPQPLGDFVMRAEPEGGIIEAHLSAQADGSLHFRARQQGRALEVGWSAPRQGHEV